MQALGETQDELDRIGLPKGTAKTQHVRAMFDSIAPRYDLVNRVMTLGFDQWWRRRTVEALGLPENSLILDLGCGTGDLSQICAHKGHRAIGADLSWGMLEKGRSRFSLDAVQADATDLPFPDGSVDGVVSGYALRNLTDLAASMTEVARVLRPGGRLAVLEVAAPRSGMLRAGFDIWFWHVVPAIGGILSDKDAYHYLPRSVAYLPDEAGLRALLSVAGFATVGRRLLSGGLSQLITATRTGLVESELHNEVDPSR